MYQSLEIPDKAVIWHESGGRVEPILTLVDEHGGRAQIVIDDHCYILLLHQDDVSYKKTAWWFPEAIMAMARFYTMPESHEVKKKAREIYNQEKKERSVKNQSSIEDEEAHKPEKENYQNTIIWVHCDHPINDIFINRINGKVILGRSPQLFYKNEVLEIIDQVEKDIVQSSKNIKFEIKHNTFPGFRFK